MKIKVAIELDIANPGTIADALRAKALAVFKARKVRLKEVTAPIPPELKAEYDAATPVVNEGIKKLLGSVVDFTVLDTSFESTDVVTKEEEASILAPEG